MGLNKNYIRVTQNQIREEEKGDVSIIKDILSKEYFFAQLERIGCEFRERHRRRFPLNFGELCRMTKYPLTISEEYYKGLKKEMRDFASTLEAIYFSTRDMPSVEKGYNLLKKIAPDEGAKQISLEMRKFINTLSHRYPNLCKDLIDAIEIARDRITGEKPEFRLNMNTFRDWGFKRDHKEIFEQGQKIIWDLVALSYENK